MRNLFIIFSLFYLSVAIADDQRLISVIGKAQRELPADMANLTITVWAKDSTAKEAQAKTASTLEEIKKSLGRFKVAVKDLKTNSYLLRPETVYDPKTQKQNPIGFIAEQGIVVTIKNLTDIGPFMDSLGKLSKDRSGVNIDYLSFDLQDKIKVQNELLEEAVKNAKADANRLANAAGVKLKKLYRLSPQYNGDGPRPYPRAGLMKAQAFSADSGAPSSEVFSGDVKISAEVISEYTID